MSDVILLYEEKEVKYFGKDNLQKIKICVGSWRNEPEHMKQMEEVIQIMKEQKPNSIFTTVSVPE